MTSEAEKSAPSHGVNRGPSGSLLAGLEILRCLASAKRSLGLSQIAAQTGQPKATIYRLLRTHRNLNYVTQMADTRKYALNVSIVSLAQAIAKPFLPPPETLCQLHDIAREGGFDLRVDAMLETGVLPILEVTGHGINFTPMTPSPVPEHPSTPGENAVASSPLKELEMVRRISVPLPHPKESPSLQVTLSASINPQASPSDSEMEILAMACAEKLTNAYWPLLNLTTSH